MQKITQSPESQLITCRTSGWTLDHDKFASSVRLHCTALKSQLQKTTRLKILRRGPVTRFRLSSFSCNRAPLFHTWHCLSPQIFSRQRAVAAALFASICDAPLTAINAKYKPEEATFDILEVKRSIPTRGDRFVERFSHSALALRNF